MSHMESPRGHILPWCLLGALALLAPWMLGGRAPQAHAFLGTLAWLAAAGTLVVAVTDYLAWRRHAEYDRRRGRALPNPLAVLGRGLLWTLPVWAFLVLLGISGFNSVYERVGDTLVLQEFQGGLPLVVDATRSLPGIYFLTGLLASLALLSTGVCRIRRRWLRAGLALLLLNACLLAVLGLFFRFGGNGLMLGRFEPRAHYFFATFYYKNHWAAYALLYCGVAACFFFRDLPRWLVNARQAGSGALALIALFFLGLTFPVVDSRSGILLFALLIVLIAAALIRFLPSRGGRSLTVALALATVFGFAWLSSADLRANWHRTDQQIARAGALAFDEIRALHAPEVCLSMLADRPLFGWGYLSYDPLFPVYATDYFRDQQGQLRTNMEFAHNDWLQHTAEFGLVGMGLLLAAALLIGLRKGLARERGQGAPEMGYGWIRSGILCLGLFALWDFPFSNPAVLANAAVLCLVAYRLDDK